MSYKPIMIRGETCVRDCSPESSQWFRQSRSLVGPRRIQDPSIRELYTSNLHLVYRFHSFLYRNSWVLENVVNASIFSLDYFRIKWSMLFKTEMRFSCNPIFIVDPSLSSSSYWSHVNNRQYSLKNSLSLM